MKNYTNILRYVQHQLSKSLYKGLTILFAPCCDTDITAAWTCTAANTATLTLTLSREINLQGNGLYRVNVANGSSVRTYSGDFTDGDTITITSVTTPGGGGAVTITGNLFLPTNFSNNSGVYITIDSLTSTAPSCV